jgi:hypothetical protein
MICVHGFGILKCVQYVKVSAVIGESTAALHKNDYHHIFQTYAITVNLKRPWRPTGAFPLRYEHHQHIEK